LAQKEALNAPKAKGILGHESGEEVRQYFRGVAANMPKSNRWDAKVDKKDEVDEEEWN